MTESPGHIVTLGSLLILCVSRANDGQKRFNAGSWDSGNPSGMGTRGYLRQIMAEDSAHRRQKLESSDS